MNLLAWSKTEGEEKPELFTKMIFTGAAGIRPKQSEEAKKKSQRYRTLKNICEIFRNVPGLSILADKCETALRQKYGSKDFKKKTC